MTVIIRLLAYLERFNCLCHGLVDSWLVVGCSEYWGGRVRRGTSCAYVIGTHGRGV